MNLSQLLITIPGICYLGTAINEAVRGNWAMASVYLGYSFANCGLWVLAK